MKDIYVTLEKEFLKQSKKENFNKKDFNKVIEQVIKSKFPNNQNFAVVNVEFNGKMFLKAQCFELVKENSKRIFETTDGRIVYVYKFGGGNELSHEGFITCEDIETNLHVKQTLKENRENIRKKRPLNSQNWKNLIK